MVDTARLGCGDSLKQTLTPEIGFEFSEYAQHVQEGLARSASRVYGLLDRLEDDAALLQPVHDVLQILDAAREAINPGHDERVTPPQEIEQRRQLSSAGAAGAARLLGSNNVAAGGAQRLLLQGEILAAAGHAYISIERHGSGSSR